jgi:hypothetical protein
LRGSLIDKSDYRANITIRHISDEQRNVPWMMACRTAESGWSETVCAAAPAAASSQERKARISGIFYFGCE